MTLLTLTSLPLVLTGCSDSGFASSDSASEPAIDAAGGGIQPLCKLGCMETDPYPDSAGVFLGSGVADDVCFNGSQTDTDQDGLSTFC